MKKLLYVRHGETYLNEAGILSGQLETRLTEKGIGQATEAGKVLREKFDAIDLIVCSTLDRTYETALLIAHELGYPVDKLHRNEILIERTFGVLDGTLGSDFLATHKFREFDDVEGAETTEQLQERAAAAFAWLQTLEADNILVVGHGAFARAIKRVVAGLPYTDEYLVDTSVGNAAIIELV